ncbi:helix-turn-helix domain-containing protein [Sphingobacterium sp. MYb382]|uniref:helix-turn-helix domain-containing protein n=1 Tax=Sphingobacterium sp. MYb382 TaxID=2745278 RepID=UPI0030B5D757
MSKHNKNIPTNSMADDFSQGISIDKIYINSFNENKDEHFHEATQSHRDEGHTFHIVEEGTVLIEIDFKKYTITAPTIVYMHPNQVHRILNFTNTTVCSLSIKNENLNPEYIKLLEEIAPTEPLPLTTEIHIDLSTTFSLCLHFSKQKSNRMHHLILKDSCNTLVALIISLFLSQAKCSNKQSRDEFITKSFKNNLEENYASVKRPADYATRLNISTHYLNQSVKKTTGLPVSQHIQDRIILEAKRLLHHTDKSVKEIAVLLGYEDYSYFSRLFSKATGMSALSFRSKRHG